MDYDIYVKFRNSQNLRDSDVAKRAGIPQSTFSDWKKGKSSPKTEKLDKIRRALGISMNEFFGDESSVNPIEVLQISAMKQLENLEAIKKEIGGISKEAFEVAKKFEQADDGLKDAICKLLDINRDFLDSESSKEA